jgi:Icc protein
VTVLTLAHKARYQIVQLSDCHLLADIDGDYNGIKPGRYLQQALLAITADNANPPDAVIISGDLSQDHSFQSYQLLAQLLQCIRCPVLILPGNHDDYAHLDWLCRQAPVVAATSLQLASWQLMLLDTKSDTPAGRFERAKLTELLSRFSSSPAEQFWLFSHHHPLPLGSAIDKHGWLNAEPFWQLLATEPRVKGVAHGHCHHAYSKQHQQISIVGCPASSVQFCQQHTWQIIDRGPMYCQWFFSDGGQVSWQFQLTNG